MAGAVVGITLKKQQACCSTQSTDEIFFTERGNMLERPQQ